MRGTKLAGLLLAFVASGCGGDRDSASGEATKAGAPRATAEAVRLKPGAWDSTSEIVAIEAPGVPASALGGQQKIAFRNCITAEQAARPASDFFAHPDAKSGRCKQEKFAMDGGKLSAVLACSPGEGGQGAMRMAIAGTYAPERYETDVTTTMAAVGGQPGEMRIIARTTGRYAGEQCDPASAAAAEKAP